MRFTSFCASLAAACAVWAAPSRASDFIDVPGAHLDLLGPRAVAPLLKQLAAQAERALPFYARELSVRLPAQKIKAVLYDSHHEFWDQEKSHAPSQQSYDAVTHPPGELHMFMAPRADRANVRGAGPGELERVFLHELVHGLLYRAAPSYSKQPLWLSEGVANALAERALCGTRSCLPYFQSLPYLIRERLDAGTRFHLEQGLMSGKIDTLFSTMLARQLLYGGTSARRAHFRSLLGELNKLRESDDVAHETGARFRRFAMREPGGLPSLEREVLRVAAHSSLPRWQLVFGDLRNAPGGQLVLDAKNLQDSLAISTAKARGPLLRVGARAVLCDRATVKAGLVFGYRNRGDYYVLTLGQQSATALLERFQGDKYVGIASQPLEPNELKPGQPHSIELRLDGSSIEAALDGKTVFAHKQKGARFAPGRYGFLAGDGCSVYSDIKVAER